MKRVMWIWMCVAMAAGVCRAQLDLPREVLKMDRLDRARKEATMKREALIFLKVNPANSQDFVEEAVEDYVRRFKRFGPILLVPLNVRVENLPDEVEEAFEGISGNYPQLVVIDPEDDTVIAKVPYLSQDDRDDEIKEYRRTVHGYLRDKKSKRRVPVPKPLY